MKWFDDIFSFVWDIADWFWQLYYESQDIQIVGAIISPIFYSLYKVFWSLLTPIVHFGEWADDQTTKIANAFTRQEGAELSDYAKNILRTRVDEVDKLVSKLDADAQNVIKPVLDQLRGQVVELSDYAKNILAMDIKEMAKRLGLTEEQFRDWLRPKISTLEGDLSTIGSSLRAERETIDRIDKEVKGNTTAIGENTIWITSVKKFTGGITLFFTDPEDWLYKAADRIIERFW